MTDEDLKEYARRVGWMKTCRYVTNETLRLYSVERFCSNCNSVFKSVHKYGEPAPPRVTCSECGVFGATK